MITYLCSRFINFCIRSFRLLLRFLLLSLSLSLLPFSFEIKLIEELSLIHLLVHFCLHLSSTRLLFCLSLSISLCLLLIKCHISLSISDTSLILNISHLLLHCLTHLVVHLFHTFVLVYILIPNRPILCLLLWLRPLSCLSGSRSSTSKDPLEEVTNTLHCCFLKDDN